MPSPSLRRTANYKPFLAWFCAFALVWTTFLLYAGGFTTSIQAGMAFLDWPLSNGSINPDGWLTEIDKAAEHSHRLLGAKVGLLTVILCGWILVRESRRWLRRLSVVAALLVVFQGGLGGARVMFDQLNTKADHNLVAQSFAVAHACSAQIFLCVLATLAAGLSRPWIERSCGLTEAPPPRVRVLGLIACGTLFLQLVAGAIMRHSHAALAIPTFPLTPEGALLPAVWSFPVTIHFIHRAGAVVVTLALVALLASVWLHQPTRRALGRLAGLVAGLLVVQVYLGALVVWSVRNPHAATFHMLCGAFLLASTYLLTLAAYRHSFRELAAPAPAPRPTKDDVRLVLPQRSASR
jgi:heme a synthase